ncbi:hypothetical protein Z948_230 [Sulfitobacter donghicola DSW-25 = KCTC 12864 = JCM 14565]|nr:hypothetical protein Z948_230 [Sulfitobacter donghicola DSW-25 = KCTC 12864 = JCM 14565]
MLARGVLDVSTSVTESTTGAGTFVLRLLVFGTAVFEDVFAVVAMFYRSFAQCFGFFFYYYKNPAEKST